MYVNTLQDLGAIDILIPALILRQCKILVKNHITYYFNGEIRSRLNKTTKKV